MAEPPDVGPCTGRASTCAMAVPSARRPIRRCRSSPSGSNTAESGPATIAI